MFEAFVTWMQAPGQWNDAMVLCGLIAVGSAAYGIFVKD